MIDETLIKHRLVDLHKNLKVLRALQSLQFDEFLQSTEKIWAVEHGLQISIQVVLDIGNHLLAELGENDISDYFDVITRLGRVGVLPTQFSESIKQMAGFRNLLVHGYTEIDLKEVYRVLQENLRDFEIFGKHVEVFLDSQRS